MNELQVLKNGYTRFLRTAISAAFILLGALFWWLKPDWVTHLFFFAAAAIIAFPVIRQAFIALGYKKIIAKVHGRQPFFRPFFAGEPIGNLRLQAHDARLQIRDLRFQAMHFCAYEEREFKRMFRKHGFLETAEILMQERAVLERRSNELVMRGTEAGIGPIIVQDMLVHYGLEETKARIAAVEQGAAKGLAPGYMLEYIEERGLARTWADLEDFELHARLLNEAEKLGCRDVILTAIKQFGYDGALSRLREIAKSTGQRIAV